MKFNKNILIISSLLLILVVCVLGIFLYSKEHRQEASIPNIDGNTSVIFEEQVGDSKLNPKSVNASVPIFMYHFVRDDTGDYEYPENMIKPETLREQLEYIKNNGYETIYKDDILHLENFTKPVWLTFDDGWEDFYLNAFPLFKEYNMKASYYVITNLIGTPGYANLDQLKEMRDSGLIDIQSHTVTHPRLATLSNQKIIEELSNSKNYLKENLSIDSIAICYPYGSFNEFIKKTSEELGYNYGLAMDGGVYYTTVHKDIYSIPRIYANRSMSLNTFANYLLKSNVEVVW